MDFVMKGGIGACLILYKYTLGGNAGHSLPMESVFS